MPTAVLAAAAFADVMPPAIYCAIAWAIDVRGVTLTPVVVEPAVTEGTQLVITSPDCIVIGFPVPGSMKVPPVIRNITVPAYAPSGMLKLPVASTLLMPICGPIVPLLIEYAIIVPEDVAPMKAVPLIVPWGLSVPPAPGSWPVEFPSWVMRACMSASETPDLFIVEPMKEPIAVERPEVPAVDDIIPPIMPPIPAIEMAVDPIIPSMTPSDASFMMAVTIPEDDVVIPWVFAYWDIAAMDMP